MKKKLLLLPLLFASLTAVQAQQVTTDNFDRLEVHYQTPALSIESQSLANVKYSQLLLAGYQMGGEIGSPALPVRIDMITIPFCEDIVVEVANAVYDTFDVSDGTFYPLQPSRRKSDTLRHEPEFDAARYATDAFYGKPLASVEVEGVARDRRLANLTFSPVQVNPVSGKVIVCRSADVTVLYRGADVDGTLDHFRRYYTPAFSAGSTLNSLFSAKDANLSAPVRMVIVAPGSLRCHSLNRFAEWKRKQGLMVDLVYTTDANLSGNSAIADYLKDLYTNATVEAPAPAYLLLVGDHAQINAFDSRLSSSGWNDHITDLYFVTWTSGDNLPDCYQGRFSATDTATVLKIVDKTLYYEQYAFEDDSYLALAALVAGEDNGTHQTSGWMTDQAWIYCDPTMDYIARYYINADNGYDSVSYYKNNTDFAPAGVHVTGNCSSSASASTLRDLYGQGLGWINYSAHGDWDRWHKPAFTKSQILNMNNNNKPSVMIGNCCLTNKFDKDACFGESLIRRNNNAGAVIYIGGTNSTTWTEDFYWSIGIRSNIHNDMNTDYNSHSLGMYDRLFHTHGEAANLHIATAGSMVMAGNMSVNASSSSYKRYYWEIYELMGDPSLLPWCGRAAEMNASFAKSSNTIEATVAPYAYVAIVDSTNHRLLASAFADADGHVSFTVDNGALNHSFLSVTAQGYKPFFRGVGEIGVGIHGVDLSSAVTLSPNPATDRCTVSTPGLLRVELLDLTGRTVGSSTRSTLNTCTLDLSAVPAGLYLLRLSTNDGVAVKKLIVTK